MLKKIISIVILFFTIFCFAKGPCEEVFSKNKILKLYGQKDFIKFLRNKKNTLYDISAVEIEKGFIVETGKMIGEGEFSVVYCIKPGCHKVIKIPKDESSIGTLRSEIEANDILKSAKIPHAKIYNIEDKNPLFLIKKRIYGKSAREIIDRGDFSEEQIYDIARLFMLAYEEALPLDTVKPENFIWSKQIKRFVLVDSYLLYSSDGSSSVDINEWRSCFFSENQKMLRMFEKSLISLVGRKKLNEIEDARDFLFGRAHAKRHLNELFPLF